MSLNHRVRNVAATLAAAASMSFAAQAQIAVSAQAQSVASTLVAGPSVSATAAHAVLTKHVPALITSGHATRVATQAASQQMQLVLSLPLRNQDALNTLLADLYNPASTNYHQWLQPAQFDAQFGPSLDDYSTVVSWARSNGFNIVARSKNLRVLTIEGSTSLVNRAFHVTETTYHDDNRNRDFRAPDREPTTDLSVPLLAVSGLENVNPQVTQMKKAPDAELSRYIAVRDTGTGKPNTGYCAAGSCTGSGPNGTFVPSDIRAAYYGGSLTGTGQVVAVFSYDGYNASDISQWYSTVGVTPSTVPITNVPVAGFVDGTISSGQDGEQTLDIIQVQGMAPGLSQIYFYESGSAVAELNQMASDNYASVITSSWGGGDFGPACDPALLQMMAQGQSYLNATGDSGAFNGFTYLPASSDPYITQVGGTDLVTVTGTQAWSSETGWLDSGGGFYDPTILIPSWQAATGVINSTNAGSTTLRNSPDIAGEANFDNTQVSEGTFLGTYGGTSYATPRLAGYIALANQQSVANGTGRIGFLNPTLYQLGLNSQATYFHDITSGKNTAATSYNGVKAAFNAVAGYDDVTGWGSPNGPALLNALVGPNFAIAASASSASIVPNNSGSVNFTVTPINNFTGTPTFTVTGLPSGVTGSITSTGTNSYSLPLAVASGTTLGTYPITVTAASGPFTHSVSFNLYVVKRAGYDFTISATSVSVALNSSANSVVTVKDGSGYSGPVDLTVSGVPTGVTTQFGTPSTFSTSNLTFIVGTGAAAGTYTVTVTGNAAGTIIHTATLTLTITAPPANAILDGGFEQQTGTIPWNFTSTTAGAGYECSPGCGFGVHSGSYFAYINGFGATDTDTLSQTFSVPMVNTATLTFWLWIATAETSTTAKNDTITISVTPAGGTATTLATFSNLDKSAAYVQRTYDLSAYRGQTVTLTFTGKENSTKATAYLIDDVYLFVQ